MGRNRKFPALSLPDGDRACLSPTLNVTGDKEIACRLADDWSSYWTAFRLVYDAYVQVGLTRPNHLRLRFLPHQLLDSSSVMLAERGGIGLGTLSIVEDASYGLPLERLYPAEIARLRSRGKRVAELTCLAVRRTHTSQRERTYAMTSMLQAALAIAGRQRIDVLAICIHPRHAKLYRERLGFIAAGVPRCCPWVCGQPAVAMFLSLPVDNFSDSRRNHPALERLKSGHSIPTGVTGGAKESVREAFEKLLDVASPFSPSHKRCKAA